MKRNRQREELERRRRRDQLRDRQLDPDQLAAVGGGERECERPPRPWPVAG